MNTENTFAKIEDIDYDELYNGETAIINRFAIDYSESDLDEVN